MEGRCLLRLFFLSSRRRHTRCSRDWSSDVCSSDLVLEHAPGVALERVTVAPGAGLLERDDVTERELARGLPVDELFVRAGIDHRSAERSRPATEQRSEEHTSELQSRLHLVCRLLLE